MRSFSNPLLFMISLVIFPKQHEKRVSQPKVYAQTHKHTHTETPTDMILWCKKWISDPWIKWSVPHDSKCLRNPWFLPYFTWQGPRALLPHSHFKAFFSCVFWVRTWISLVQYVLQWWWHCSQNERLQQLQWQPIKKYGKPFKRNIILMWFWF